MVRSRAASTGDLRAEAGKPARTAQETANNKAKAFHRASARHFRLVPPLVMVFLAIAAFSLLQQWKLSRTERLAASEVTLMLAAELVASEIARLPEVGAGWPFPSFPARTAFTGRRFFAIDGQGQIIAANAAGSEIGRSWQLLFSERDTLPSPAGGNAVRGVLASGEAVTVVRVPVAGRDLDILAHEPVSEELLGWRRDVHAIGAVFLSFTATVIILCLAYYAQRERVLKIGFRSASQRSEIETALEHGRCGLWNLPALGAADVAVPPTVRHLLGIPPNAPFALADLEARLHPEDRDLFVRIEADRLSGAGTSEHLFRIRHETRGWIWLRMRLLPGEAPRDTRMIGILMDVTAERAAEDEMRRVDACLRDAIESISEAFVLWDDSNRLVMCNSKYRDFHAVPAEAAQRGTPYRDVMACAHAPRIMNEVEHGTPSLRGARSYEVRLQDGRWLLVSERHTSDGGYVSVGTDISARKQQEEQLLENERQLRITIADLGASREAMRRQTAQLSELADRYLEQKAAAISANRAKAEFLANMHHEIRTPINHIIGFAEMIEQEIFGPCGSARYVEYASDIRRGGADLMALISDILDMAQVEAGRVKIERTPTPIGALLEDAISEVCDAAASKSLVLEIEPTATEPAGQILVAVDAAAISKAMVQLLRNSIRLSPEGGRVSVRARLACEHVNIFIADAGCVLSDGDIGTMSDAFGHIDGMLVDGCKGSGLNVPIARALIELHGGTMRMRSAPGYGSMVMIRLPLNMQAVQLDLPIAGIAA